MLDRVSAGMGTVTANTDLEFSVLFSGSFIFANLTSMSYTPGSKYFIRSTGRVHSADNPCSLPVRVCGGPWRREGTRSVQAGRNPGGKNRAQLIAKETFGKFYNMDEISQLNFYLLHTRNKRPRAYTSFATVEPVTFYPTSSLT